MRLIKGLLMTIGTVAVAFIAAVIAGGAYSRFRHPNLDHADKAMADTDEMLVVILTFTAFIIAAGAVWLARRRRSVTLRSQERSP